MAGGLTDANVADFLAEDVGGGIVEKVGERKIQNACAIRYIGFAFRFPEIEEFVVRP